MWDFYGNLSVPLSSKYNDVRVRMRYTKYRTFNAFTGFRGPINYISKCSCLQCDGIDRGQNFLGIFRAANHIM